MDSLIGGIGASHSPTIGFAKRSFFVLEKMAAVIGVPNPAIYASFRGETLEQFLTRKQPITYSVAGQIDN